MTKTQYGGINSYVLNQCSLELHRTYEHMMGSGEISLNDWIQQTGKSNVPSLSALLTDYPKSDILVAKDGMIYLRVNMTK